MPKMTKAEFLQQVDAVFARYASTPKECRDAYYDCLKGCPDEPDPTNCRSGCRDDFKKCLDSIPTKAGLDTAKLLEELAALEKQRG